MRKVGIITMHRPLSFGSALQAYALLKKIRLLGFEAQLIDYQYPNKIHGFNVTGFDGFVKVIISFFLNALLGFPNVRKRERFKRFYKNNYSLSEYYPTAESLKKNPPLYDIYFTGSDQVWNALFTKSDTSFLLSFVDKNARKFSYASSFAINYIPEEYRDLYLRYLSEYEAISVREQSGVDIIKKLIDKDATCVCDPTLLLTKEEWDIVADQSKIHINKPYILAFILGYSFNPYPQVYHIIELIQKQLGVKVVYLDGRKNDYFKSNSSVIKNAGPSEFIELIRHADYIITDSFHGVVFSSLYERPFSAIVKKENSDSRVLSYLEKINMTDCAINYDVNEVFLSETKSNRGIHDFRLFSENYLKKCLNLSYS